MNDIVRGLVLLASVLLWLPFLRPVLSGELTVEQGLLRYAGTLLLAWTGGAGLSALVRSYAAQGAQQAAERQAQEDAERAVREDADLRRRAEDQPS